MNPHQSFDDNDKADLIAGELGCKVWHQTPQERPKGMRRDKFDRLVCEHAALVERAMKQLRPRLARAHIRGLGHYVSALLRAGM